MLCPICKNETIEGRCIQNLCLGTDYCIVCHAPYEVTEDYMIYGYCPKHEGDMPVLVLLKSCD